MQETLHEFPGRPVWQRQVRLRLAACMVLATVLLALVLMSLQLPESPATKPPEITLQLLAEETPPDPVEEFTPIEELVIPAARDVESFIAEPAETLPAEADIRDWYADVESVARDVVDASESAKIMQPAQQEARRLAAIQFAPSRAPVKKPIWENVEIDQMGRKVLRSGDCYRVLEDWRATYMDIQREFGQYLVHCSGNKEYAIDVDWIDDIGQKYAYIRFPDGEIPVDELNQLIRKY